MPSANPNPIIWNGHLEPLWPKRKPLIINVATGWLSREQNPTQPYTLEEIADEVVEACEAGASMWHFHVRHPETGGINMPQPERVEAHMRTCDRVFRHCPEIVTDVSGAYPLRDDSVEARITPYFEPLAKADPHYADVAVLNMGPMAMGIWPRQWMFMNTPSILFTQAKLLEEMGIKPELACYDMPMIEDSKAHFVGNLKDPCFFSLCQGIHNTEPPKPELTKTLVDQLPDGVVWQAIMGGRNWLPLSLQAILLGCDVVRVGMEDTIFLYPDREEKVQRCADVVRKIATIARELGRDIATCAEARERLALKEVN